jgi:actin-related protein
LGLFKSDLVNWNTELEIWDRLFGTDLLDVKFDETRLLLTDPSCIVPAIKNIADEVVFETYQFASLNMTCGKFYF